MDINQNNSQKNTFSGGMDLDTSASMISSDKYRMARNVHYVTNKDSNSGELRMINGVQMSAAAKSRYADKKIIGTATVQDLGAIVYVDSDGFWGVDKFKNPYEKSIPTDVSSKDFVFESVVSGIDESIGNRYTNKLSCLLNYESEENVKLYIADGEHYLLVINIMEDYPMPTYIGLLESIPRIALSQPVIKEVVSGQLKYPVVQYAFQVYNKYGQQSEMSPVTRLLSLPKNPVDYSLDGKSVIGVAPEETTNCGVSLSIPLDGILATFDKAKIYRISYAVNGQLPLVELIFDGEYNPGNFGFVDTGQEAVATLTLEEFNSISGHRIIPKAIEQKDGLLFAANLKEPTFSLGGFDEFDARCYSFDPFNCQTHLYNYNNDEHLDFSYDNVNDISNVPVKHDCYNRYTDINKTMYDHNSVDRTKITNADINSGIYDRFDGHGDYYGGSGTAINWRFVVTELIGDSSLTCNCPAYGNAGTITNTISLDQNRSKLPKSDIQIHYVNFDGTISQGWSLNDPSYMDGGDAYTNYSDPITSSVFKSLRRDEVYRFGIVLYDKNGIASPVKWIQDIRTPGMSWKGFEAFSSHGVNQNYRMYENIDGYSSSDVAYDLGVRPLGIQFLIDTSKLPKDCTGYEIVRCNRTFSDMATVSQGVVSRPIKTIHNPKYVGYSKIEGDNDTPYGSLQSNEPYTPTGFLTTARYWAGSVHKGSYGYSRHGYLDDYDYGESSGKLKEADNLDNASIYQFVSPELVYQKDSFKTLIKDVKLKLSTEKYIFGSDGGPKTGTTSSYHTDPRFIVTPSASNINLRIMGDDWESLRMKYAFDVSGKRWRSGTEDFDTNEMVSAGVNQRYQIYNDHTFTPLYFYRSRVNYLNVSHTYDNTNSSHTYVSKLKSNFRTDSDGNNIDGKGVMSIAKKTREALWNTVPSNEKNGNQNVIGGEKWPPMAAAMYSEIKLYEQSNDVWCRQHMKGVPSADFCIMKNGQYDQVVAPLPSEVSVKNTVGVDDIAFPEDLGWDDFAKSSSDKDGEITWNLTYPDKITTIGSENYCNWTTNGSFNISVDVMKWGAEKNSIGNFTDAAEGADQAINGPAGKCMLLKIDNLWETANEREAILENEGWWNLTEGFLLTDTIGCSKTLQRKYDYRPYEYYGNQSLFNFTVMSPQSKKADSSQIGEQTQTKIVASSNDDEDVPFYRNSILGTYLCNLRKQCTPYSGSDYLSRTLNTYYSYGGYRRVESGSFQRVDMFCGDCYIQPMEYTSLHKYYNSKTVYQAVANINYSIPVETSYNLAYTYGEEPSRSILKEHVVVDSDSSSYVQEESSNVANRYSQTKPEYAYNTVYSTNATSRVFQAYDPDNNEEDFSYRCRYSNAKSLNEEVDSWCKFMPANYLDVDSKFGDITGLCKFHNYLYYWQESAFGKFSVNERSQLIDQNNMALALGSGGVLDRYDYITEYAGMKDNQFVNVTTPTSVYWWDYDNHTIWSSDGEQSIPLSKVKFIQSLLNDNANDDTMLKDPVIVYDNQSNDVIMRLIDENGHNTSIVYNEQAAQFVAIDDVAPKYGVLFDNCLYLVGDRSMYRWNAGSGQAYGFNNTDYSKLIYPTVQYVVNAKPEFVKTFDNAEFAGRFYEGNVTPLNISFSTPLKQEGSISGKDITSREYSFRYAVPRNGGSVYGDRMKGKFMNCELTSSSASLDFSLQYILNTFRISCS